MGARIISASRYLIIIAVICIFITGLALLVYGAGATYELVRQLFNGGVSAKSAKAL
jgi:uncharacterized membrane protein YqhA